MAGPGPDLADATRCGISTSMAAQAHDCSGLRLPPTIVTFYAHYGVQNDLVCSLRRPERPCRLITASRTTLLSQCEPSNKTGLHFMSGACRPTWRLSLRSGLTRPPKSEGSLHFSQNSDGLKLSVCTFAGSF